MSGLETATAVVTTAVAVGGSGIGAFVVWRNRKLPAEQHELAESVAEDTHWKLMMTTQIESVVKPLNERMAQMDKDQRDLKIEVKELREQLESQRTRFWGLINHVRQVKLWIIRHVPPEIYQQHPLPTTTEELTADIAVDIT